MSRLVGGVADLLLGMHRLLETCSGGELRGLGRLDLYLLARTRVDALTGCAFDHGELAEARDYDLVAFLQRLADCGQERLDRTPGIRLGETAVAGDCLDKLTLVHGVLPFDRCDWQWRRLACLQANWPLHAAQLLAHQPHTHPRGYRRGADRRPHLLVGEGRVGR